MICEEHCQCQVPALWEVSARQTGSKCHDSGFYRSESERDRILFQPPNGLPRLTVSLIAAGGIIRQGVDLGLLLLRCHCVVDSIWIGFQISHFQIA